MSIAQRALVTILWLAATIGVFVASMVMGPGIAKEVVLVAGLSMSCWVSALVLGVFSQLKPMGFEGLQAIFAPVFLAGLAGALAFGLGASLFAGRGRDWGDTGVGRVPSRMLGM